MEHFDAVGICLKKAMKMSILDHKTFLQLYLIYNWLTKLTQKANILNRKK